MRQLQDRDGQRLFDADAVRLSRTFSSPLGKIKLLDLLSVAVAAGKHEHIMNQADALHVKIIGSILNTFSFVFCRHTLTSGCCLLIQVRLIVELRVLYVCPMNELLQLWLNLVVIDV